MRGPKPIHKRAASASVQRLTSVQCERDVAVIDVDFGLPHLGLGIVAAAVTVLVYGRSYW